ncbi:MAG: helix-turn-helix domain-containing protein [Thermomicrobiales bacterium]
MRERTQAGLAAARARGRIGGRPRKLTDVKQRQLAQALYESGQTDIETICRTLDISRATLYRFLKDQRRDHMVTDHTQKR